MYKSLAQTLIVSALAVGATLAGPSAAGASTPDMGALALTGCASGISAGENLAWASCMGGTGTYRAVGYCRTSSGGTVVRWGVWRAPRLMSYGKCASTERIVNHAIQTSS